MYNEYYDNNIELYIIINEELKRYWKHNLWQKIISILAIRNIPIIRNFIH